jgi:hypothetical protein
MKEVEQEAWCPKCREVMGVIYRVQVDQWHWRHETKPSPLPKYCNRCEQVVERRT